jgi:hypothetical protein
MALSESERDEHQLAVRVPGRRKHQPMSFRFACVELLAAGKLGAVRPLVLAAHELLAIHSVAFQLSPRCFGDPPAILRRAQEILTPGAR